MERWYFGGFPRGESSGKGWDPHKVLRNPTKKSAAARKSDRKVKFVESVQTLPSGRVYNKLSDDGIALLLSMCVPLDEDGSKPADEQRCVESVARALQRFGSESQHVIQAFLLGVYTDTAMVHSILCKANAQNGFQACEVDGLVRGLEGAAL